MNHVYQLPIRSPLPLLFPSFLILFYFSAYSWCQNDNDLADGLMQCAGLIEYDSHLYIHIQCISFSLPPPSLPLSILPFSYSSSSLGITIAGVVPTLTSEYTPCCHQDGRSSFYRVRLCNTTQETLRGFGLT